MIVGGGFTGLWAAIQAKEDDPGRDVVVLESGARRHRRLGSQRRVPGRLADPRPGQRRLPTSPTRSSSCTGSASTTSRRCWPASTATGSTPRSSARASSPSPPRHGRCPTWPRTPSSTRRFGAPGRAVRPRRGPGRGPLAHLPRRACGCRRARRSSIRPGSPGGCAGPRSISGCGCTSTPRSRPSRARGRRGPMRGPDRPRRGRRRPRVLLATNAYRGPGRRHPGPGGAGVGLRADDRAALARAARLDRLGPAPGPGRRGQPVPLLPAHAATTASSGAATTPSTSGATASAPSSSSGRRRRASWPGSSSRRSRSSTASGSRTAGAGRSPRRRGSR